MQRLKITLLTISLSLACNACWAQLYPSPGISLYTNPQDPLDVDDNHLVQPHDLALIINRIQEVDDANQAHFNAVQSFKAMSALAATPGTTSALAATPSFYWDTNGDGRITPQDALLVVNQLNSVSMVPEPSTLAMAALGLLTWIGCGVHHKRRPFRQ